MPGDPIQYNAILASGANTVLTSAYVQNVRVNLNIVTAATITMAITKSGGSAINVLTGKTFAANSNVSINGISLGIGDVIAVNSNQSDTTCTVFQAGSNETPLGVQVTEITGSLATATTSGTRFQASWIQTNTTGTAQDCVFFIATAACKVVAAAEVHAVAAGGASTMQVVKDTGTDAPGGGTDLLTSAFNLNATANTVQSTSTFVSAAAALLAAGDRLAVDWANAVQSTTVACVTATLEWV